MIHIEVDNTFDNNRMKGKIKTRVEEARFPEICAFVYGVTETIIENFQIPEELKNVVGFFVSSELQKKYKKNMSKEER